MSETIYAKIIKDDDGFHVVDQDGSIGPVCKIIEDGRTITLTKNASGRQYCSVLKADAAIAENGCYVLPLKTSESRAGKLVYHMPNEKLIAYLPQELQDEYKAIITRAIAARDADKKQPMTELEKAKAKLEKAKAALAKLEAEASAIED